jgi:hypothetical protein
MQVIVKVQVPLAGAAVNAGTCLVYDIAHRNMSEQPLAADVRKALRGDLKGYFRATWSGTAWVIGHRVIDQYW